MNTNRTTKIFPVILAGGLGTRLWPLSTREMPKQFAKLFGNDQETLFQKTLNRIRDISEIENPIIICNQRHLEIVKQQCREINICDPQIILEPIGRNTAPAIAIAALYVKQYKNLEKATLLVLPSDHVVNDISVFVEKVENAKKLVRNNYLVCFGIKPTSPETGYGYIKIGESIDDYNNVYTVDKFIEKPPLCLAQEYVDSNKYLWNGGMFMFDIYVFLNQLCLLAPDILSSCQEVLAKATSVGKTLSLNLDLFANCRNESIDYAVMEKTKCAVAMQLEAGWRDLGSWLSLWEYLQKDASNNVSIGRDVILHQISDSYVCSTGRKVVVLGVNDCIVIETSETVLVLNKSMHQELKKIIEKIENK